MPKIRNIDMRKANPFEKAILGLLGNESIPRGKAQTKEELKQQLMSEVGCAIDEKLSSLPEGHGLGIVFRIEELVPGRDKQWANNVKERAKGLCEQCGKKDGLHAHHIKSVSQSPELSNDLGNGIALCKTCHAEKHPEIVNFIINQKS